MESSLCSAKLLQPNLQLAASADAPCITEGRMRGGGQPDCGPAASCHQVRVAGRSRLPRFPSHHPQPHAPLIVTTAILHWPVGHALISLDTNLHAHAQRPPHKPNPCLAQRSLPQHIGQRQQSSQGRGQSDGNVNAALSAAAALSTALHSKVQPPPAEVWPHKASQAVPLDPPPS